MDTFDSGVRSGIGHEFANAAPSVRRKPALNRLARGLVDGFRQAKDFVAGLLIGLSVWAPVFITTAAEETEWQQYGLPGGLAMFGAGIWLRIGGPLLRRRASQAREPSGPSRPGIGRLAA